MFLLFCKVKGYLATSTSGLAGLFNWLGRLIKFHVLQGTVPDSTN